MPTLFYRDSAGNQLPVDLLDGNPGPTGPQGAVGPSGSLLSVDAGNNAVLGTDGKVHVTHPTNGGLPIGVVVPYGGTIPPAGWFVCDGTAHGSAELAALIGPNTPDLRDKFIRAAGTMAPGAMGGSTTVGITASTMPSHNHSGVSGSHSANHIHGGASASAGSFHQHSGSSSAVSADHVHTRPSQNTGGRNANHTHPIIIKEGSGDSGDGVYTDSNPNGGAGTKNVGTMAATPTNHVHYRAALNTAGRTALHIHAQASQTATSVAHTHSLTSGGASAGHTHSTSAEGGGQGIPTVPGHYILTYLVRG